MKTILLLTIALVCCVLATGYVADAVEPDVKEVVWANNGFGNDLFTLLAQKPGNLLISPLSLQTVMAMILSGASGKTADEVKEVLGLSSSQKEVENGYKNLLLGLKEPSDAVVHIANKLFVDKKYELQSGYEATATEKFLSGAAKVDMKGPQPEEAVKVINEWVEQQTNRLIKNLVDVNSVRDAALVAVNALHFKANWSSPFPSSKVSPRPFFINKDEKKNVAMMNQILKVPFFDLGIVKVIKLKYQGDYSMVILLPSTAEDMDAFMEAMPTLNWEFFDRELNETYMDVYVPKFLIESSLKLSEPLKQLGIKKLFTDDAELTGIINERAGVSEVVQKTFIKVAEKGTEAAAATALASGRASSCERDPYVSPAISLGSLRDEIVIGPKFIADHPFVFAIKHDPSGAVLFLGRYSGPE